MREFIMSAGCGILFYFLVMQIVQCIQTVHTKEKRKKNKYQGGILWRK